MASLIPTPPEPKDYCEAFVWPNYVRFRDEPGSKLLAMNAAVATYHFAEWIAACELYQRGTPTAEAVLKEAAKIREGVRSKCMHFDLLSDLVDAYKHAVTWQDIKRPGSTLKTPRLFTELIRVNIASRSTQWHDDAPWDDEAIWKEQYESVVVVDRSNGEHELLLVLNEVVAYWGDEIYKASSDWAQRRPHPNAGTGCCG